MTEEAELQREMVTRVRRHVAVVVGSVVLTLVLLAITYLGTQALFRGAMPRPFALVFVGIFFIPLVAGVLSARANLRCPACNTSVSLQLRKRCPGCGKDILVVK
jgi:hypothetical protein